jgi:hypothetical protein
LQQRIAAHFPADGIAIHSRHDYIQDDKIWTAAASLFESLHAIICQHNAEFITTQTALDGAGDNIIIFDDKDIGGTDMTPPSGAATQIITSSRYHRTHYVKTGCLENP